MFIFLYTPSFLREIRVHQNFVLSLESHRLWLIWIGVKQKRGKNTKIAFLPFFELISYIGWTTSMPFTSIYSMHPRTNPWNFHEKILRIDGVENLSFFCVGHFDFFLLHSYWNVSQINGVPWMELNFYDYHDFQKKARGVYKYEQHCTSSIIFNRGEGRTKRRCTWCLVKIHINFSLTLRTLQRVNWVKIFLIVHILYRVTIYQCQKCKP